MLQFLTHPTSLSPYLMIDRKPQVTVGKHVASEVMPHLEEQGVDDARLDLVVLGGTRIIRGKILEYPKYAGT